MALHWLGFVKPVINVEPVDSSMARTRSTVTPTHRTTRRRTLGALDSECSLSKAPPCRSAEQTAVATFFSGNPVQMYRTALCDLLEGEPLGLLPTTRLFARIDAAVANSFIQTWRLKYDIGFWRPVQAIAGAETDGNGATQPNPTTWTPLVPNPAYSDYTSGHGAATSPFAQVLRRTLGDDTSLTLTKPPTSTTPAVTRHYATLTALEHDTLNARIWGGLHFRDAMEDTYYLGHTTADRVIKAMR